MVFELFPHKININPARSVLQNAVSLASCLCSFIYIYILFQIMGFHCDGTEEPFWVPQRTVQENNIFITWRSFFCYKVQGNVSWMLKLLRKTTDADEEPLLRGVCDVNILITVLLSHKKKKKHKTGRNLNGTKWLCNVRLNSWSGIFIFVIF